MRIDKDYDFKHKGGSLDATAKVDASSQPQPQDMSGKWSQPKDASSLDVAFGAAESIGNYLPSKEEIPEEFWNGKTHWNKLTSKWFFSGCEKSEFVPKDGIDRNKALRHIGTCLVSFEPKHEHKEAGCAYLMSLWFVEPSK